MSSYGTGPSTIDYAPYFDRLIAIQEKAIVSYRHWTFGCLTLGFAIVGCAFFLYKIFPGLAPSLITGFGGAILSGSATWLHREIAPRRSRIATYVLLKQSFEVFPRLSEDERKRLRDLADEAIKRQI
jgi:hypothetical protein